MKGVCVSLDEREEMREEDRVEVGIPEVRLSESKAPDRAEKALVLIGRPIVPS